MGCLRNPRTTQEKRANQGGWRRAKRKPKNLPNAWDDILRSDMNHRTWKRHRRTQWK